MMALDECTPFPCDRTYAEKSLALTHMWLNRGIEQYARTQPLYGHAQTYFPIVQGSVYPDLRARSAEYVASLGMEGHAIGGLAVGEPAEQMYEMIEVVNQILPLEKPRYLMGVGTPANILEAIARGVDMFDCVMPTRNGRNGQLFTRRGIINIRNEKWKNDFSAIDPEGDLFVDREYSKAYLRHLVISGEILGLQIASIHNLGFYLWLVREARRQILLDRFTEWKDSILSDIGKRL